LIARCEACVEVTGISDLIHCSPDLTIRFLKEHEIARWNGNGADGSSKQEMTGDGKIFKHVGGEIKILSDQYLIWACEESKNKRLASDFKYFAVLI
jgi:hypothetical protein